MNGLASDSDFLNVDWYEWKEQGLLMVSLKNVLVGSNGPNYARKMACLYTSGSALRIFFFNFTQWKGPRVTWKLF